MQGKRSNAGKRSNVENTIKYKFLIFSENEIFNQMKITKHILFTLFCLGIIGCGNNPKYSKNQTIPNGLWEYENPLTYDFEVGSTEVFHDLFFSIKFETDFDYQNIYVKIITEYPTKESIEDIVSLNLTNGAGSFLGDCNSSTCTTDILLLENFKFMEAGEHTIKIYQHSRDTILKSVIGGELKLFEREKT